MKHARSRMILVCLLSAVSLSVARAEEAAPPASSATTATLAVPEPSAEPAVPFVGKVTGSKVNVRAGANPNFEVIHHVVRGEPVIVEAQAGDWYAITLPPEASCFIAAKFVAREAGSAGRVTGANVNLRGGPGTKFNALGKISAGESVSVLGEQEGWLRIVPPSATRGWIAKTYVQADPSGHVEIVRASYQSRGSALTSAAPLPATAGPPGVEAGSQPIAQGRLETARGFLWKRPEGTHQLMHDHHAVAFLMSETVALNDYLHQDVSVWGRVTDPASKIPRIAVSRVAVGSAKPTVPATQGEATTPSSSPGTPPAH